MLTPISTRQRWRLWLDVAQQAWYSLSDRRFRTLLSVGGIAIGVAAVTLIQVVTHGGREVVFSELQTFGLRSVWVSRDRKVLDPLKVQRVGSGIDNSDYEALRNSSCCLAFTLTSPVIYGAPGVGTAARVGRLYSQVSLEGVKEQYMPINNDILSSGRPFSATDVDRARPVAIIGAKVRDELFGPSANPIGRELRLDSRKFEVIGVLTNKDRSLLASIGSGSDANGRVLVPYTRLQAIRASNQIDVLQGQVRDGMPAAAVAQSAADFLQRRHQGAYHYQIETMEQYVQTANNILNGVALIGGVAASVSLFVAGLGILNIMSTAVLERTREIGVRKALGGGEREILLQFLFEAGLISLFGGLVGLALGGLVCSGIAWAAGLPLDPTMLVNGVSLLVAIGVGLISGLYPAYLAAHLRPVEALRYE
jgi:ABC-type antimicrobial peptide transport system permease subunit